jgi:hypothetical protein
MVIENIGHITTLPVKGVLSQHAPPCQRNVLKKQKSRTCCEKTFSKNDLQTGNGKPFYICRGMGHGYSFRQPLSIKLWDKYKQCVAVRNQVLYDMAGLFDNALIFARQVPRKDNAFNGISMRGIAL